MSSVRSRIEHVQATKKIVVAMVGLGVCARLVPHPWNFTPILAISLYSGAQFAKIRTGLAATLVALLLSDVWMGFYPGMWYVYAASVVPVLIGRMIRGKGGVTPIAAGALASSLSFFVLTNLMVWATSHLYPHNPAGLAACFAAAIPFFQNQFLGDAFYTTALFGGHALAQSLAERRTRTAF